MYDLSRIGKQLLTTLKDRLPPFIDTIFVIFSLKLFRSWFVDIFPMYFTHMASLPRITKPVTPIFPCISHNLTAVNAWKKIYIYINKRCFSIDGSLFLTFLYSTWKRDEIVKEWQHLGQLSWIFSAKHPLEHVEFSTRVISETKMVTQIYVTFQTQITCSSKQSKN